jgi:hypothetical protein
MTVRYEINYHNNNRVKDQLTGLRTEMERIQYSKNKMN